MNSLRWYHFFEYNIKNWGIAFNIQFQFGWNDFYSYFKLGPFSFTLNYTHEYDF